MSGFGIECVFTDETIEQIVSVICDAFGYKPDEPDGACSLY